MLSKDGVDAFLRCFSTPRSVHRLHGLKRRLVRRHLEVLTVVPALVDKRHVRHVKRRNVGLLGRLKDRQSVLGERPNVDAIGSRDLYVKSWGQKEKA